MFRCDQLTYIQMQKTGCTHIASLLSELFDGERIGKHNAAKPDQIASDQYFVSSIRNPWDWYLSLWTFGVAGNGGLRGRLTNRQYSRALKSAARDALSGLSSVVRELFKGIGLWEDVYASTDSVESFRKWLKLLHDPRRANQLGEGYGNTTITGFCGFMTYRYLYLCCQNAKHLNDARVIGNYSDLVRFERTNCYIDFFVRQESLETDLCSAIEKIRQLTMEEKKLILDAKRSNASLRSLSILDYYDSDSIDLIGHRDRLLIDKFNYSPPS